MAAREIGEEHKAAMAEGRKHANNVKRYLEHIADSKPKRGRRRTVESITARLAVIDAEFETASALAKLGLHQERDDLNEELKSIERRQGSAAEVEELRQLFIESALPYAQSKELKAKAFRQMGVDPKTLKEAGIS